MRAWSRAAHQLAAGLVIIALLACMPTLPVWRDSYGSSFPLWALGLVIASSMQIIYAAYLAIWPSAVSLLTVGVFGLLLTTIDALLLVTRLLVSDQHAWVRAWQLDINTFSASQEAGWCFVMLLLIGTWSYIAGRAGLMWLRWEREG